MKFITFIYKIGNNVYYGKHVTDYISDDHDGLDIEVKNKLLESINKYRKQKNYSIISDIDVGVISFSSNNIIPIFSSDHEIKCFNYYYEEIKYNTKIYINGKMLS